MNGSYYYPDSQPSAPAGAAYVSRHGRLTRDYDNVIYLPRLSIQRIVVLLIVLTTLLVTNPANGIGARELQNLRQRLFVPLSPTRKLEWDQTVQQLEELQQQQQQAKVAKPITPPSSTSQEYYSYFSSLVTTATKDLSSFLTTKDRYRNYGIFVVGRKKSLATQELTLTALLHTVVICRTDSLDELEREFCSWVEDVAFHRERKQQQGSSLAASTVIQFGSWFLMTAVLCSICTTTYGKVVIHMNPRFQPWLFQLFISIWTNISIWDVLNWNWIAKSALLSMEQVIRASAVDTIHKGLLFWISSLILLLVIGIITTQYASRRLISMRQSPPNLDGMFATCLGYVVAVGNQRLQRNFLLRLFRLNNIHLTYPTFFWIRAGQLLLMNEYGTLVAVLTGGVLGHSFGFAHTEWILSFRKLWW